MAAAINATRSWSAKPSAEQQKQIVTAFTRIYCPITHSAQQSDIYMIRDAIVMLASAHDNIDPRRSLELEDLLNGNMGDKQCRRPRRSDKTALANVLLMNTGAVDAFYTIFKNACEEDTTGQGGNPWAQLRNILQEPPNTDTHLEQQCPNFLQRLILDATNPEIPQWYDIDFAVIALALADTQKIATKSFRKQLESRGLSDLFQAIKKKDLATVKDQWDGIMEHQTTVFKANRAHEYQQLLPNDRRLSKPWHQVLYRLSEQGRGSPQDSVAPEYSPMTFSIDTMSNQQDRTFLQQSVDVYIRDWCLPRSAPGLMGPDTFRIKQAFLLLAVSRNIVPGKLEFRKHNGKWTVDVTTKNVALKFTRSKEAVEQFCETTSATLKEQVADMVSTMIRETENEDVPKWVDVHLIIILLAATGEKGLNLKQKLKCLREKVYQQKQALRLKEAAAIQKALDTETDDKSTD